MLLKVSNLSQEQHPCGKHLYANKEITISIIRSTAMKWGKVLLGVGAAAAATDV